MISGESFHGRSGTHKAELMSLRTEAVEGESAWRDVRQSWLDDARCADMCSLLRSV